MFSSPLVNPVNSSLVGMHRYGSTLYIQDIHNGIYNPNFTYTGGQSLVRDENGILRYTPPGVPAIEGGRYIDTVADGAELGPELVVNEADRTFSSDTLFWVKFAGWSISNGVLEVNTAVQSYTYKTLSSLSLGHRYLISYQVVSVVSGSVAVGLGADLLHQSGVVRSTAGTYSDELVLVKYNKDMGFRSVGSFVGSVDNYSIREVIPHWERPTGSTYISIPTRKGVRQVQTDPEFLGQLIEPAMTNKLTIVKANPTAVTGIVVAGGAAYQRI